MSTSQVGSTQIIDGAIHPRVVAVGPDGGSLPVGAAQLTVGSATIVSGQSLSAGVDLGTARLVGVVYPAAWTAGALTFQASADGTNYFDLYDAATERSYTVTTAKFVALSLADWLGVRFLKLRSGTAGTPVAQGADRAFTLVTAP